jgi:hypothetical protein
VIAERKERSNRAGGRFRFRATVERLASGYSGRYRKHTILLRDITDASTGGHVASHEWFTQGQWSSGLGAGYVFEFDATAYSNGMERPNKVTVISKPEPVQEEEKVI